MDKMSGAEEEGLYKCTLTRKDGSPCTRSYDTEQQLRDHLMANHWKQLRAKR